VRRTGQKFSNVCNLPFAMHDPRCTF